MTSNACSSAHVKDMLIECISKDVKEVVLRVYLFAYMSVGRAYIISYEWLHKPGSVMSRIVVYIISLRELSGE